MICEQTWPQMKLATGADELSAQARLIKSMGRNFLSLAL